MKRNDTTDGLLDGAEVDWDVVSGSKPPLAGSRTHDVRPAQGNLRRLRGIRDDERETR